MSETTLRFEAIGTGWELDTALPLEPETVEAVAACIDRFDRTWSRFRDDAFIARFAAGPVSTAFPDDAREDAVALLDTYRRLHDATAGAVTPFIGTSLERLGYDASYSLVPQGPAVAALQSEMACDIGLLGRSGLAQEGEEGVFVGQAGGRPLG
jgi:thiamine biosynthesis lipoprotein